jgi:hypothetical protein
MRADRRAERRVQANPVVVVHTASPVHGLASKIYYEVNETGTRNVVAACLKAGVKKLVYTSSTGVVWTGAPFKGVTEEQVQVPKQGYDAYHHTKALGEAIVLEAGKKNELEVVVLRPCGMTGFVRFWFELYAASKSKKTASGTGSSSGGWQKCLRRNNIRFRSATTPTSWIIAMSGTRPMPICSPSTDLYRSQTASTARFSLSPMASRCLYGIFHVKSGKNSATMAKERSQRYLAQWG